MRRAGLVTGVLVVGCLAVLLIGCTQPTAPTAGSSGGTSPAPAESAQPAATGGSGGWIADIPAVVPKFEFGTFDQGQSGKVDLPSRTVWSLYYEGVKKEDAQAYFDKLKAAGFTVAQQDSGADIVDGTGKMPQGKDELIVSCRWQTSGHIDLSVQIVKH